MIHVSSDLYNVSQTLIVLMYCMMFLFINDQVNFELIIYILIELRFSFSEILVKHLSQSPKILSTKNKFLIDLNL